jgi:hypothetical protein
VKCLLDGGATMDEFHQETDMHHGLNNAVGVRDFLYARQRQAGCFTSRVQA